MTTGADAAASDPALANTTADGGGGNVEPALVAPPAATSWNADGVMIEAGEGREIVLALVRDFDGDGQKDALAIVRPPIAERKPSTPTGELLFFHGGEAAGGGPNRKMGPPTSIAVGPPLAVQPSCAPVARLEKIGPRSAFAEIGSACPRGAASRSIIVVRLTGPTPAIAFDALVVDPALAPKLTIDVDAADRDKDGIDDVVLRLGMEAATETGLSATAAASSASAAPANAATTGTTTPRLGARLAFFDRPAGPSRDPEEPEASLRTIASQAVGRAGKAKDAPSIPPLVQQMRALYRAMCLEGGAPRITKIHGGSATACGNSKALEDAGVAEARAWLTQGDALRAFAAAESAQVAPSTKTAAKTTELQKLLAEAAPVIEAKSVRTLTSATDPVRDGQPEWGPLAFEYTGKLLVRHGKTVARVDAETGEGEAAEIVPWKDEVTSPDGKSRWLDAYHACEGVALHASFVPIAEGDMNDVALPIAPRLGKSCTGSGGRGESASAVPIAWGPRGLEALVLSQPVLIKSGDGASSLVATSLNAFLDETPPPGSPRSHNGKNIALERSTGVLVRGRTPDNKWSLVRGAGLEPYTDLRRCTINDDASRIACVRRGKVVLATLP